MKSARVTNLDLPGECDYVVSQALAGENAIVLFGCLIFLAYATGDSFALDIEDKYACPLCMDGEKLHFPLLDTGSKWVFEWPWRYFLARETFTSTGLTVGIPADCPG